ncbi:ABC transporter permease [Brevibacterium yomogidense]|uniref:L-proline glycine betaine ABC transport system permease protein ProW (TC 3.A.1.12.1) n=1 Tax=Brevibacterium yomogidense TaxID=946573 RepID=A0A1X6XAQ1_9MICO|nr:ABC transporter permease subunit [Brevibacterium yomogidense]SLM96278.1 L-proline glycine betaine ABC transport system permease protein ProW (TC 3.A.1.12.1) [Brevibacterium yomogidense]
MTWMLANGEMFAALLAEHTVLALLPTVIGLLVAVPLGAMLRGLPRARSIAVVVAAIVFTIPSLALFVVIPGLIGTRILDPINVVLALSLYSLALLVRSVLDALDAVPGDVRDAARAMGYAPLRRIVAVDLPVTVPVLTPALRVVAVTNVSLVSVGAVIGIGGLGSLFTAGYQRSYPDQILAGIIGTVALALLLDRLIALAGWSLTRWRRTAGAAS